MVEDRRKLFQVLDSDVEFDGTLEDAIKKLETYANKAKEMGLISVEISTEHDWENRYLEVSGYRYETDAEYNKRLDGEKAVARRAKEVAAAQELRTYERLKKKYGETK